MIGRLGRSEISPPQRRALWAGRYLEPKAYSAFPPFDDWTGDTQYNWFLNDKLGTCTITALAHMWQQRCALIGETCKITDDDVLRAYERIFGYDGTPATDRGGRMSDVLSYLSKYGLHGDDYKIDIYIRVNHRDLNEMRAALHCTGSLYVGADLPKRIMTQGTKWFVPAQPTEDDRPRSLGGHAFIITGAQHNGWWAKPWIDTVEFDDHWLLSYVDEAAIILDQRWIERNGVAPNGFDYERLLRDFDALRA